MITYCTAWTKNELYMPKVKTPSDKRLHIPNSSGIKTLCRRNVYKMLPEPGNADLMEVCQTCRNNRKQPIRKLRHLD